MFSEHEGACTRCYILCIWHTQLYNWYSTCWDSTDIYITKKVIPVLSRNKSVLRTLRDLDFSVHFFLYVFAMISWVIGSSGSSQASAFLPQLQQTAHWALSTCPACLSAHFLLPLAFSSAQSYPVSVHWCPWSSGILLLHHYVASGMNWWENKARDQPSVE